MPRTFDTANTFGDRAIDEQIRRMLARLEVLENGRPVTPAAPVVRQSVPSVLTGTEIEVLTTDLAFDAMESGIEFDQADFAISQSGPNAKANLAAVIAAAGPIGDSTHVAQVTYDAKGRLLLVTSVAISFPTSGKTRDVAVVTGASNTLAADSTKIYFRIFNTASNTPTLQLPDPTAHANEIWVRLFSTGNGDLKLVRFGTEKIENVASDYTMHNTGPDRAVLKSDGVDWWFFATEN